MVTGVQRVLFRSSGKDFSDYYVFDYTKQTMLCHRLVSAMQKEFDYTLNYEIGRASCRERV